MVEMQVSGMRELQDALKRLPDKIARNALRSAVNAGAAVIRNEARARVPTRTGRLRKAIYQRQIRERSGAGTQTFYVGWRARGTKRSGKSQTHGAFYGRFVEFGTSRMAAKPFLRPAFEARKHDAVARIREKLRERITRVLAEGT